MAWIESHQGLANHPKTRKVMRRLGVSAPVVVGHLHFLWWWALDFAQDGEITQYDAYDIADACHWQGDAEKLYESLIEAGFIDIIDNCTFLHDWYDYAGKLIEIRKKDALRKKKSRGKDKESDGHPEDIQRTSIGRRTESIRDLNLDLNTTTTEPETVDEIHRKVFGTMMMNGLMTDFIRRIKAKGYTDVFIRELMLETGECGTKPSLRLMESIYERWDREQIFTRAEARKRKESKPYIVPMGKQRADKELEARRMEIARNKWIAEGKNPDEFVYQPASSH